MEYVYAPIMNDLEKAEMRRRLLALIPLGIALNLALGVVIHALRFPIYLDAVGTIAITIIAGLRAGMIVGVGSFLIGGLFIDPVLPWFSGTQAAIALYTHLCARLGWFRSVRTTVAVGIGMGIVAGIVSAPVIVMMFGGVTGSGRDLITGVLLGTGQQILKAVALSGIAAEPIDKTIQCLLGVWLLRGIPQDLLSKFSGGSLANNGLMSAAENDK
jgi:energy-coupling factor transport system substrate-specific component